MRSSAETGLAVFHEKTDESEFGCYENRPVLDFEAAKAAGRDPYRVGRRVIARFWSKVNVYGPVPTHRPDLGQCWLWTASLARGYGQFTLPPRLDGRHHKVYAHRFAYELTYGKFDSPKIKACHACDNPLCCRPSHMFAGTQQDNLADARRKGRLIEARARRTSKLTPTDRLNIFYASGEKGIGVRLSRQYGVTKGCISRIRRGRFVRPSLVLEPVALSGAVVRVPYLGEVA